MVEVFKFWGAPLDVRELSVPLSVPIEWATIEFFSSCSFFRHPFHHQHVARPKEGASQNFLGNCGTIFSLLKRIYYDLHGIQNFKISLKDHSTTYIRYPLRKKLYYVSVPKLNSDMMHNYNSFHATTCMNIGSDRIKSQRPFDPAGRLVWMQEWIVAVRPCKPYLISVQPCVIG